MQRALQTCLRWAVFEQNDEALWGRAREAVEALLLQEWRQGALVGSTPEEAFFVRCDHSTMNEFDLARGQLIVLVGLAFIKPTEFAVLRIEQSTVT